MNNQINLQVNEQFLSFSKQFADSAFKAHALTLNSLQTLAGMQFKTLQEQAEVSSQFVAEAMETRDMDGVRALWEKGTSLSRDNAERAMATSQEMLAVTQKTAESLAALVQEQRQAANEAANEAVSAPVAPAKKKAAR
ncbi:MAG: phasin family protein [Rhodanobacter sp.]